MTIIENYTIHTVLVPLCVAQLSRCIHEQNKWELLENVCSNDASKQTNLHHLSLIFVIELLESL